MTYAIGQFFGILATLNCLSLRLRESVSAAKNKEQLRRTAPYRRVYQPLTPPAVRPLVRCFSMPMNMMTTGMMAKMEAAKRYCHSIIL